jgi:hypothetical protein
MTYYRHISALSGKAGKPKSLAKVRFTAESASWTYCIRKHTNQLLGISAVQQCVLYLHVVSRKGVVTDVLFSTTEHRSSTAVLIAPNSTTFTHNPNVRTQNYHFVHRGQRIRTFTYKGKGKFHPVTGHKGSEVEKTYSSTLPLTSTLDVVGVQHHALAALSPGKTRYSLCRALYLLKVHLQTFLSIPIIQKMPNFEL